MHLLLLPLLACAPRAPEQAPSPGTLVGSRLAAPAFTARSHDGGQRNRDDLVGNPTVMWFFPKAATAG